MTTDSLKKRYGIKLLANIITGVINALLIAIVPKALGPLAYGHFIFLQQFYNQLISFFDASTSTAFFTKLSADNNRKELIPFYFVFSIVLLFTIFAIIIGIESFGLHSFFFTSIPVEYIYLAVLFGFFTWVNQIFTKISDAFALTVSVELIKIVHKIFMLVAIVFIINNFLFDLSVFYYFQIVFLFVFVVVLSFLFTRKGIVFRSLFNFNLDFKNISQEFYKYCSPLFIFNLVAISVGIFDIWLLQKISGSVETGFYGLAYSIAAMCFLFTSAMTPVIMREFSKYSAIQDMVAIKGLFARYVPMLYAIAAYFSIFIAFEAENLLAIFTDKRFEGAYLALIIIAFYPLHQTYGQINAALLFATEDTIKYRNIGLFSSVIGLIFSFLFIYWLEWGAVGFACKMILIQIISVNIQLFFNVKKLMLKFRKFVAHQIYTIVFFCSVATLSALLVGNNFSIEASFLVHGLSYTLLAIIGLFVFPVIIGTSRSELHGLVMRVVNRKTNKV